MDFTYLLDDTHMTIYECSKRSGIPYSTLSDILHGKTPMGRSSFRTAFYLSRALGISMEELFDQTNVPERTSFELFKSSVCHKVKELGDEDFILSTLRNRDVRKYYGWEWYPESLYVLAMLDYISKENNIPLCSDYDELRYVKLAEPIYPESVLALYQATHDNEVKKRAIQEAIPEFLRHNIIESEVRNVI